MTLGVATIAGVTAYSAARAYQRAGNSARVRAGLE
jgi:hypothetical protein